MDLYSSLQCTSHWTAQDNLSGFCARGACRWSCRSRGRRLAGKKRRAREKTQISHIRNQNLWYCKCVHLWSGTRISDTPFPIRSTSAAPGVQEAGRTEVQIQFQPLRRPQRRHGVEGWPHWIPLAEHLDLWHPGRTHMVTWKWENMIDKAILVSYFSACFWGLLEESPRMIRMMDFSHRDTAITNEKKDLQ